MINNLDQLRILQIVTLGMFIGMFTLVCFLVLLTRVQIGGVNYAPVEYFETYNHCGKVREVSDA